MNFELLYLGFFRGDRSEEKDRLLALALLREVKNEDLKKEIFEKIMKFLTQNDRIKVRYAYDGLCICDKEGNLGVCVLKNNACINYSGLTNKVEFCNEHMYMLDSLSYYYVQKEDNSLIRRLPRNGRMIDRFDLEIFTPNEVVIIGGDKCNVYSFKSNVFSERQLDLKSLCDDKKEKFNCYDYLIREYDQENGEFLAAEHVIFDSIENDIEFIGRTKLYSYTNEGTIVSDFNLRSNRKKLKNKNWDDCYQADLKKIKIREELKNVDDNSLVNEFFKRTSIISDLKAELNINNLHIIKNECRKAVLTKKQFKCNKSVANYDGMYAASNVGNFKNNQEDGYLILNHPYNPEFKIMVVADGMGGHDAGELASNEALVETIRWFEDLNSNLYYGGDGFLLNSWEKKLYEIDKKISSYGDGRRTTYASVIILENMIIACNIGNSRIMRIKKTGDKHAYRISNIQSDIYDLYEDGIIENLDDARFCYDSNLVTNSLGMMREKPSFFLLDNKYNVSCRDYYDHDECKIVICSDGVSNCLSLSQMFNVILNNDAKDIPNEMVCKSLTTDSVIRDELKNDFSYYEYIDAGKDNATCVAYTLKRSRR